ncbi:MAG: hypothetical protein E7428_09120 [Ruminococcaceae bacterium]|nr:hypothetical protein [Oscillospiraceae bacterium]
MKHTCKRITAFALVLLMTLSLLASCSGGKEKSETADTYLGETVDLGLGKNEKLMDIIEVDGELRATVGVESNEINATYGIDKGIPYKTEYRYYDMAFVEDVSKRESTTAFHEVGRVDDLVFCGEPYAEDGAYSGVQYRFYLDGQPTEHVIVPEDQLTDSPATRYNARVNLMEKDGTIYAGICGINYFAENVWSLYIGDHFVKKTVQKPGVEVELCGLMEVAGTPYALIREYEMNLGEYDYFATEQEATYLIPLNSKTTDLSGERVQLEGTPTGGAFSDGQYGYYMCGSELWRTDGKTGKRIADLIYCGVDRDSEVRGVRALSNGRLLVVANGGLIVLTESESAVPAERNVYTLGLVNYHNYIGYISTAVAKFNGQSEKIQFTVKEYPSVAKMNLALLSGEVDLIVSSDHFLLKNYIKQGILASLEKIVPEFFEEGVLIENVVDATRVDGTCYFLPRHFSVVGRRINRDILEEGQIFETPEQFYDFTLEKTPGTMKSLTKSVHMTHYGTNIDEWIDWETNKAHFDDGSFEALLEFCNHGAPSEDELDFTSSDIASFFLNNLMFENDFADYGSAKVYDGEGASVAYPFPSATHDGYDIDSYDYFCVVDREESQEAAREFLTYHFLEDVIGEIPPDDSGMSNEELYEAGYREMPINQAECERVLSRNLSLEGEEFEERLVMERRRYKDTWKIIRSADHLWYFRNAVFDVMMEESLRYFAGDITAKQAADYVQNRISLYLAEQG